MIPLEYFNMIPKIEIVTTSDGSHSLYVKELDENYHSAHGAIQEAVHVFINNGLAFFEKDNLSVFEVGFGTGLNALLALDYAVNNKVYISYTGIETHILDYSLVQKMNYLEQLNLSEFEPHLKAMHESDLNAEIELNNSFTFTKQQEKVQDFTTDKSFDVIFYDAFSPTSQIEMWDISIFEKLYTYLNDGGALVTYCAKGQLKRDLKSIGFEVETLPGPPGKREMVRAVKKVL